MHYIKGPAVCLNHTGSRNKPAKAALPGLTAIGGLTGPGPADRPAERLAGPAKFRDTAVS